MSGSKRWVLLFAVLTAIAGANGCASDASRQFYRDLNPLIGKADKAYFIEKYGDPDKRTATDSTTDVWEYLFAGERLSEHATRSNLTTSTQLRLTFRNGILASWQASNVLQ